jgi:hypothetical protein
MRSMLGKILLCGLLSLLLLLSVCFLVYADTAADLTGDYTASGVPDREQATPPAFHGIESKLGGRAATRLFPRTFPVRRSS